MSEISRMSCSGGGGGGGGGVGQVESRAVEIGYGSVYHGCSTDDVMKS